MVPIMPRSATQRELGALLVCGGEPSGCGHERDQPYCTW